MEQHILVKFGSCLQNARINNGLSQEQLAKIVGLDRTYISLLERGKRNPSIVCISSLCQALNLSLSQLFLQIDKAQNEDKLKTFCENYDLELEYLTEILNDPKVIPMIRGKSFEFTVQKFLSTILPQKYQVTNPRMNPQSSLQDIDVAIINTETSKKYSIECKLTSKGSFRNNSGNNPYVKVKCMRSRTLGKEAALQRARVKNLSFDLLTIHNDQYTSGEFDFVVTSIANAFYKTDEQGLFYWSPEKEENLFLTKIGINTQKDAFKLMYIAKSNSLMANRVNQIKCSRKKCQTEDCNFIPNYPVIYFDKSTGKVMPPWFPLQDILNLFD